MIFANILIYSVLGGGIIYGVVSLSQSVSSLHGRLLDWAEQQPEE